MPTNALTHAVHAAAPLAVLEAVQGLDTPEQDEFDEFHEELTVKRLGLSRTVAAQIERFRRLARRGARADVEEFVALLRLVSRRHDARLVFSEAGRRVAQFGVRRIAWPLRLAAHILPWGLGRRIGLALARGRARAILGITLRNDGGVPVATLADSLALRATPDGAGCAMYGSALAELLRLLTDFDGAMLHVTCRARGGSTCEWRAESTQESSP